MLLNQMIHFSPIISEFLLTEVAFMLLLQSQMNPLLVVFPLLIAAEDLLAIIAFEAINFVQPFVTNQQQFGDKPRIADVAYKVPEMHVHVFEENLVVSELYHTNRAAENIRIEFERNHLVSNICVHSFLVFML